MNLAKHLSLVACSVLALATTFSLQQTEEKTKSQQPDPSEMMKMMEAAQKFTQPGEHHKVLERFIGNWDVESRLVVGGQKRDPEMGSCEFSWLMKGRWITSKINGKLMGNETEGFSIMGYDNFKKSFVSTSVNSMDTSMLRAEGDLTRDGRALITYGTLNEYLTGEHDKMVKYVWRFVDKNSMVLEIHDLHIGEANTMVIEQTFRRKK